MLGGGVQVMRRNGFALPSPSEGVLDRSWSYYSENGSSEWSTEYPCASGSEQSPINVVTRHASFDEGLSPEPLVANYQMTRFVEIANDGFSVSIRPGMKCDVNGNLRRLDRSVMTGGPLSKGHEYELDEIRFHWGRESSRGSEHTINFKSYPMEIQFVHFNRTLYKDVTEALGQPDGIAIAAMFVQVAHENTALEHVVDHLGSIQFKNKTINPQIPFNPVNLLPHPDLRDYWTYKGSLTVPPCSEGVTWILYRYPLTMSHCQIDEFRRLRSHEKYAEPEGLTAEDDGFLVDNFRATQQLNDRVVYSSFQF